MYYCQLSKSINKDIKDHFEVFVSEEHNNGDVTLTIRYDSKFTKSIREIYHRKRCTKKLIRTFIRKSLDYAVEKLEKEEV